MIYSHQTAMNKNFCTAIKSTTISIPFLEDDLEPFSSGGVSSFGGSGGGGGGCKKN